MKYSALFKYIIDASCDGDDCDCDVPFYYWNNEKRALQETRRRKLKAHWRKAGRLFIGVCPYCGDDSFSVSPYKCIAHCFSCTEGASSLVGWVDLEQTTYRNNIPIMVMANPFVTEAEGD